VYVYNIIYIYIYTLYIYQNKRYDHDRHFGRVPTATDQPIVGPDNMEILFPLRLPPTSGRPSPPGAILGPAPTTYRPTDRPRLIIHNIYLQTSLCSSRHHHPRTIPGDLYIIIIMRVYDGSRVYNTEGSPRPTSCQRRRSNFYTMPRKYDIILYYIISRRGRCSVVNSSTFFSRPAPQPDPTLTSQQCTITDELRHEFPINIL